MLFNKAEKSIAFASLGPESKPVRTLNEDFNEDKLIEFFKGQQPHRVSDGLLPIPRKVLVVPFLQVILAEVSRIIPELGKYSQVP